MTCSLDLSCQFSLAARTIAGLATRLDLAGLRDVTAQCIDIFVIEASAIGAVGIAPPALARHATWPGGWSGVAAGTSTALAFAAAVIAAVFVFLLVLSSWSVAHVVFSIRSHWRRIVIDFAVVLEGVIFAFVVFCVVKVLVMLPPLAQQDHLAGDEFGAEVSLAVVVFPAAGLQPPFNIDLLVLGQV
jgi:hypothetical protein